VEVILNMMQIKRKLLEQKKCNMKKTIFYVGILALMFSCSMSKNFKIQKNTKIILNSFVEYCKTENINFKTNEKEYFLYVSMYQVDTNEMANANLSLNIQLINRNAEFLKKINNVELYKYEDVYAFIDKQSLELKNLRKVVHQIPYENLSLPNQNKILYGDYMYWDIFFDKKNHLVRAINSPKIDTNIYIKLNQKGIKLSLNFKNK